MAIELSGSGKGFSIQFECAEVSVQKGQVRFIQVAKVTVQVNGFIATTKTEISTDPVRIGKIVGKNHPTTHSGFHFIATPENPPIDKLSKTEVSIIKNVDQLEGLDQKARGLLRVIKDVVEKYFLDVNKLDMEKQLTKLA